MAIVRSDHKRLLDEMYAHNEDPWDYAHSDYEQGKYAATLAALPEARYSSGLEIGCSEGVFTTLLADRVDRLVGVDISAIAIERARGRCAQQPHVEFREFDLVSEPIAERFDLIVCSEVLYYVPPFERLGVARRLVNALNPDGTLLLVHSMKRHTRHWEDIYGEGGGERLHRIFTHALGLPALARHASPGEYEILAVSSAPPTFGTRRRMIETIRCQVLNVYPGLRRVAVNRLRRYPRLYGVAARAHRSLAGPHLDGED
ncbi:MAG TPA: SAM-dependent methyltransferase [Thermomicrobiales bacterium]|nr:SAM-dependent methyltransferase [Thermomicrobiales bacterium]